MKKPPEDLRQSRKGQDAIPNCKKLSPREKERLFNKYIAPRFETIKSLARHYTDRYQDVDANYNYCLMQLYNYIGSYDPDKSLDTWIHICVKRACFNQNKKRAAEASHRTGIEMCVTEEYYQSDDSLVIDDKFGTLADNISDKMYSALTQIPSHRLSPFLLRVQGYGIREITAMEYKMGHLEKRSEDIVKSRIFLARLELRLILRQNGIRRKNRKGQVYDGMLDTEDCRPYL